MNAHDDRLGWVLPALIDLHTELAAPPVLYPTILGLMTEDGHLVLSLSAEIAPATDGRDECVGASPGVRNPRHQVIGVDRGSCETFPRANLEGADHD